MLSGLSSVFACGVEIICCLEFSMAMHEKYNKKKTKVYFAAAVFLVIFMSVIVNIFLKQQIYGLVLVLTLCIVTLFSRHAFSEDLISAIATTGFSLFNLMIAEIMGTFWLMIVPAEKRPDSFWVDLVVLGSMLFFSYIIIHFVPLKKIHNFIFKKQVVQQSVALFCLALFSYMIISWKFYHYLNGRELAFLVLLLLVVFGVVWEWRRSYRDMLSKQKDMEINALYTGAFDELVTQIRMRQHEYNNKLEGISSLLYSGKDPAVIVKKQKEFLDDILDENKKDFISLLKISDSVLAGLVYTKLVRAEQSGIPVEIHVMNDEIITKATECDKVTIAGVLLDNAIEANAKSQGGVSVWIDSKEGKLNFTVANAFPKTSLSDINLFFKKNYSTKGNESMNHGLGLYHAKKCASSYGGRIEVGNVMLCEENYLRFKAII